MQKNLRWCRPFNENMKKFWHIWFFTGSRTKPHFNSWPVQPEVIVLHIFVVTQWGKIIFLCRVHTTSKWHNATFPQSSNQHLEQICSRKNIYPFNLWETRTHQFVSYVNWMIYTIYNVLMLLDHFEHTPEPLHPKTLCVGKKRVHAVVCVVFSLKHFQYLKVGIAKVPQHPFWP